MRLAAGLLATAAALLPGLWGADAGRCRLGKGLYEERLAALKGRPSEVPAVGGNLLAGGTATIAPRDALATIDDQYRHFLEELADDAARKDSQAIQACCDQAEPDRAGGLFCQLVTYLNGGRQDNASFLEALPNSKDGTLFLNLDDIAGAQGRRMFPPRGLSYRVIDELFLLVMDERPRAIVKYFNLYGHAQGQRAAYMDGQLKIFLSESQSVVVNQWPVIRRQRVRLKGVLNSIASESTPAQMRKITQAVKTFCEATNPDCPEILKFYGAR